MGLRTVTDEFRIEPTAMGFFLVYDGCDIGCYSRARDARRGARRYASKHNITDYVVIE